MDHETFNWRLIAAVTLTAYLFQKICTRDIMSSYLATEWFYLNLFVSSNFN